MTSDPVLEVDALVAGYSGPVVGPVSFSLFPGDILGVLGPNGAGKSTLLKAVTGSARVFSGRVVRRPGIRVFHHHQRPDRPSEFPLTGRDLLKLTGAAGAEAPETVAPLLGRRLDRLSEGQAQQVELWASLGSGAEVILLDEPTTYLDTAALNLLTSLLHRHAPQRGVVLVSHEADYLRSVATRTLELP